MNHLRPPALPLHTNTKNIQQNHRGLNSLAWIQLGGRALSSSKSERALSRSTHKSKSKHNQNALQPAEVVIQSARKISKGLTVTSTSKKPSQAKVTAQSQLFIACQEKELPVLCEIELGGKNTDGLKKRLFEPVSSQHQYKFAQQSKSKKKTRLPFQLLVQFQQPQPGFSQKVETAESEPQSTQSERHQKQEQIGECQHENATLREQLLQEQRTCLALQIQLKVKDAALEESDQMINRLVEKTDSQKMHLAMLKEHTVRLELALRDAYLEIEQMREKNKQKVEEMNMLKDKVQFFESTASNIENQLNNAFAYLQDFKLKNEKTLQQAEDMHISELQQLIQSKQFEFKQKENKLMNIIDEYKEKNTTIYAENQQMKENIVCLENLVEELRRQKKKLEEKQAEEAKTVKEQLDQMATWFNTMAEQEEQILNQDVLEEQHEQKSEKTEHLQSSLVSKLKSQLQYMITENERIKTRNQLQLKRLREEHQSQLRSIKKQHKKQVCSYSDKLHKLMAELAKTKGRNGVRNKFDTIEEEAEEEN